MSGAVVELDGLTKAFGPTVAVDHLDVAVEPGGVVGLLGPNGAGKTTLFRLLLGLVRPTEGGGSVLGAPLSSPASYLSRVGALIEGPSFQPPLSGRKNLLRLALAGGHDRSQVDLLLDRVGLADRADDAVRAYSLGMKQRLGIAAALLPDPELVLLDEPMNGLDPAGIREMRVLLRDLAEEGRTIIVSSHNLAEVQKTSDRILVLQRGHLVHYGDLAGYEGEAEGELLVAAEDPSRHDDLVDLLLAAGRDARVVVDGVQLRVDPREAGAINRQAMEWGITLAEIRVVDVDLEERFFSMTEGE